VQSRARAINEQRPYGVCLWVFSAALETIESADSPQPDHRPARNLASRLFLELGDAGIDLQNVCLTEVITLAHEIVDAPTMIFSRRSTSTLILVGGPPVFRVVGSPPQ
jgi:hypothetical protein